MEFAHIAKRAGAREVTVLEMMEQPLGNFDPDLADVLCEATGELGIDLRTRAKVLKIDKNGTGLTVTYETPKETEVIDCDLVVHENGRVPNIEIGRDNARIQVNNVHHVCRTMLYTKKT